MKRDATWRELLSSRLNRDDSDVIRLYRAFLESVDTPVALSAHLRLKYGGVASLLEMSVDALDYLTAQDFAVDYQVVKFLSKYPFKDSPFDTKQVAINTSKQGEATCSVENEFWEAYEEGRMSLMPAFEETLMRARGILDEMLGKFPVQEWLDRCRFGPGTYAYSDTPKPSDACKLTADLGVTPELAPYTGSLLAEFPGWLDTLTLGGNIPLPVRLIPGGKHTTVPKNAKTDRNIETQPLLNLFLQLGLGRLLRERLRSCVGIDLDHQSKRNQELARQGSLNGRFATIDLSNASDTISTGLVKQLVRADWYHAFNLTRTHRFEFEGAVVPLQRFSAMGNGFTFELETMLFYALARATAPHGVVVAYGDDIIVPTVFASKVCGCLESCGFTVNRNKSFFTGPFRESCGADWFDGNFVRPFFLDTSITNVPEIISTANGLARWALHRNHGYGFDYRVRRAWLHAVRWIPPRIRSRIAWGNPDGDEYLFAWRERGDRRILPVAPVQRLTSWYAGKATALYRLHARRIKGDDVVGRCTPLTVPARESLSWKFAPLDPSRKAWRDPLVFACQRVVLECGWC